MYTITAYPVNAYNLKQTIHREFKSKLKMWQWCRDYLAQPDRKIIVHCLDRKYKWGASRERHPRYVRKVGVFTNIAQIPKW